ncbi:MAG: amidophosphoribosyltransferase [Cytophagales bacterium]|nr:MAG: amidophosphoribosyltransferase [Cytophagales bacterium]TAF61343.1 MAG: amidophosphoribosyltransferase [Cytophagales bacterium]
MSDKIKHECGIALLRLRKPLGYYMERYGSPAYAINKMLLLMEKQHNRGQDGAGLGSIKLNVKPGINYVDRVRSVAQQPISDIFQQVGKHLNKAQSAQPEAYKNAHWVQDSIPFTGEVLIGHLRYGTHGSLGVQYCHPRMRHSSWRSRTLLMAGNFNMTNVEDMLQKLTSLGQHHKDSTDTLAVLEKVGHFLEREHHKIFNKYDELNQYTDEEIIRLVEDEIDIAKILERSCRDFDGGYAMAGLTGYGTAFVTRDPAGIRPAYYYADDEIVVVASEKPAIKTTFNVDYDQIKEVKPAHALIIDKYGNYSEVQVGQPTQKLSCSFERIYFSRGTDPLIYKERKALGKLLVPVILDNIKHDVQNTVFSYIPNTAEIAYMGMIDGLEEYLVGKRLESLTRESLSAENLNQILSFRPRTEKLVIKDTKLRTFITDDNHRDDLVAHVYDTTYEIVQKGTDTLVVIDDSIVRGTTLEKSILKMLDRLSPKEVIIVSSAPQIRFPDCYGIDMSRMHDFVAFRATLELLKENKCTYLLQEVYHQCKDSQNLRLELVENHVKKIYEPFSDKQISDKVAQIICPSGMKAKVKVIYQSVENLHKACPEHLGDWYFTGNYPTKGGSRVANTAFINFMEGKEGRAY